ncbi:MAG: LysR family transcriptional regulator, partial [Mogibacterium sp.]|nr:LysR family transcriptional regulator [Mogibacterium sp.]
MQTSYEIFLLVAKEKSITKAAQKAFISQQAVSEHIKKLEDKYGLKLFTRKPHFQLTEAGEAMFRSLQQMQLIERSMNDDLSQRSQETKGSFTLGINASRAQIILPLVMPEFARMYPHVDIHFSLQDTSYAEQQLLNGEVDLFL